MNPTLDRPKPVSSPAEALEAQKALLKHLLAPPKETTDLALIQHLEKKGVCLCKTCRQYRAFKEAGGLEILKRPPTQRRRDPSPLDRIPPSVWKSYLLKEHSIATYFKKGHFIVLDCEQIPDLRELFLTCVHEWSHHLNPELTEKQIQELEGTVEKILTASGLEKVG